MNSTLTYPVMERFLTLQGEGFWTGCAAWFIRLAGCDVGCVWCDVKESWPEEAHPRIGLAELTAEALASGAPICVITGGEPLLHDLGPLTDALRAAGLRTHLETSGTRPLSGTFDWVTFSPKKFKAAEAEFYERHDELKVIVHNRHDLQWAQEQAARCPAGGLRYLQPDWYRPEAVEWIVEFVKKHPEWRMSLQTHKFMNIP